MQRGCLPLLVCLLFSSPVRAGWLSSCVDLFLMRSLSVSEEGAFRSVGDHFNGAEGGSEAIIDLSERFKVAAGWMIYVSIPQHIDAVSLNAASTFTAYENGSIKSTVLPGLELNQTSYGKELQQLWRLGVWFETHLNAYLKSGEKIKLQAATILRLPRADIPWVADLHTHDDAVFVIGTGYGNGPVLKSSRTGQLVALERGQFALCSGNCRKKQFPTIVPTEHRSGDKLEDRLLWSFIFSHM